MNAHITNPTRNEEELFYFFANSPDMLCVAGFDGFFKRLNPAWETTLGWSVEELKSRPFSEFVHPDDRALTLCELERLTGGDNTIHFENRLRCRNGSHRWLQWSATRLDARQQIGAIARDVTSRRKMEHQILEAGDREKDRLGRELHDGLCQNLAGIAALSTTLSRKMTAVSESAAAEADEISHLLTETIGHARDMARGLTPVSLERIGIVAALEGLAANAEALYPMSCRFTCRHSDLSLPAGVELHLYRIAQESLNNAITHGRGRQITINLNCRDGEGRLSIRDDGMGIPESPRTGSQRGMGIQTMDYRSRLIGGSLELRRRSLRGTKVICRFPLTKD